MSIYREYDIRGIVPEELSQSEVTKIGYALASKIEGEYVAVGYDARTHLPQLFEYLVAGLNAGGKTVLSMGLVPTPVNYFSTEAQKFKLIEKLRELLQNPPQNFPAIRDIITVDGVRVIFDHGWALVRASNTTPILVTRFESDDEATAKHYEAVMNDLIAQAKAAL